MPPSVSLNRLLSVKETAIRLGVARRTLEREVSRKKFPPPVKIGAKSLYFVSDVEQYLTALRAARDGAASPA
jgi:predicted DNA-binding transcriptional regulator AlpA